MSTLVKVELALAAWNLLVLATLVALVHSRNLRLPGVPIECKCSRCDRSFTRVRRWRGPAR